MNLTKIEFKAIKTIILIILSPIIIVIGILTFFLVMFMVKDLLHEHSHWRVEKDKNSCTLATPLLRGFTELKLRYFKDGTTRVIIKNKTAKKLCLLYHDCIYPIGINSSSNIYKVKIKPIIVNNNPNSSSVNYELVAQNISLNEIITLYKKNEAIYVPIDNKGDYDRIDYDNFNKAIEEFTECIDNLKKKG